jgi:hypothetical protein
VTSVFTAVLLVSFYLIALRVSGLLVAGLAAALLIASPGFVELSASCMVEIPALAAAVAALAVLTCKRGKWRFALAGVLFAVSLQIKFINVILLPLAALVAWVTIERSPSKTKGWLLSLTLFGGAFAVAFIAIGVLIGEGSFWLQMKQSWEAHFASTRSFEYGSAADRPFDWSIYIKNWDATIPAIIGLIVSVRTIRLNALAIIPAAWLVLAVIVFGMHKPWWPYYYIHNAIPLCWSAAIGISAIIDRARRRRNKFALVAGSCCMLAACLWAGSRVWLQIAELRKAPKLYSSLVLQEIKRFKPFTKFIYTDEPVYSFHADIPLPPKLGVVSLKRFWSGDMTNARLVEELRAAQPGLILLKNDARELPFSDWLNREYRVVYQDDRHRLHAHLTIADKAEY